MGLRWIDVWAGSTASRSPNWIPRPRAGAATIERAGLRAYCLSTLVFNDYVERGEEVFRTEHLTRSTGSWKPPRSQTRFVRLIAGKLDGAEAGPPCPPEARAPWVAEVYREAAQRIVDAGFTPTMENEVATASSPRPATSSTSWTGSGPRTSSASPGTSRTPGRWRPPHARAYRTLRPDRLRHTKAGAPRRRPDPARMERRARCRQLAGGRDHPGGSSTTGCPRDLPQPSHGKWRADYDYGARELPPGRPVEQWTCQSHREGPELPARPHQGIR